MKNKIRKILNWLAEADAESVDLFATVHIPPKAIVWIGLGVGSGAFLLKSILNYFIHQSGVCVTLTVLSGHTITHLQVLNYLLSTISNLGYLTTVVVGLYLQYEQIKQTNEGDNSEDKS